MDRALSKEEKRKATMKNIIRWVVTLIVIGLVIIIINSLLSTTIKRSELELSTATLTNMESSVAATGMATPIYEYPIICPLSTNIMEVYCHEGDTVATGQLLIRLNRQSTEALLRRTTDELNLKNSELEQIELNTTSYLTDLEMQIKTKEAYLNLLKSEMSNEHKHESTHNETARIKSKAELEYAKAQLELEQLKTKLANETKAHAAAYRSKQLECTIATHNLEDVQRSFNEANVEAPQGGVITFINNNLGKRVATGDVLAVVSDLSHFKIDAKIPVANLSKLTIGSKVYVKANRKTINGRIANISPQSHSGMVNFTVTLDNDSDKSLCSGLLTELFVVYDTHDSATVINKGLYFKGPGEYTMFVKTDENTLERRNLILGENSHNFVEVISGISLGEELVTNNMQNYLNNQKIKITD